MTERFVLVKIRMEKGFRYYVRDRYSPLGGQDAVYYPENDRSRKAAGALLTRLEASDTWDTEEVDR